MEWPETLGEPGPAWKAYQSRWEQEMRACGGYDENPWPCFVPIPVADAMAAELLEWLEQSELHSKALGCSLDQVTRDARDNGDVAMAAICRAEQAERALAAAREEARKLQFVVDELIDPGSYWGDWDSEEIMADILARYQPADGEGGT